MVMAVMVISFLGDVGEEGMMIIPCIIGHLSQLFIDSYIASQWAGEKEAVGGIGIATVVGPDARINNVEVV